MKKLNQFDEASVWEALRAVGFDIQDDDEPTDGVKIVTGDGSVTVLPSDFNLFDDHYSPNKSIVNVAYSNRSSDESSKMSAPDTPIFAA